jgi:hypothetical protein
MVVTLLRLGLTAAAWDRILDELVASGLLRTTFTSLSELHTAIDMLALPKNCCACAVRTALETEVLQASQPLSKTGIETGSIIQR